MKAAKPSALPPVGHNGEDYYTAFLGALNNLSGEFSSKLEQSERDTRRQFAEFGQSIATRFDTITSKFDNAMSIRDARLEAVGTKLLEGKQAPWAQLIALGMFLLAFGGSVGWLAYNPINERTEKVEEAISKIADNQFVMREWTAANFVSQKELENRTERGREDRDRVTRELIDLRSDVKGVVSRAEHQERWRAIDNQFADIQRQVDDVKRLQGETYTTRDAIFDLKARIDALDRETRTKP